MDAVNDIRGGLIVSCQAAPHEPLHGAETMAKMAKAALQGGAVGIRANGEEDIRSIRAIADAPIIGIKKVKQAGSDVFITPDFEHVVSLVESGATIVALDATDRKRADGTTGYELIRKVKRELDVIIMADISTFEEGKLAEQAGADLIATTLSGYTPYSPELDGPDFLLIEKLVAGLSTPIVAEGRIWTPEEAAKAFELGVHAVVIGSAITAPEKITARFVLKIQETMNGRYRQEGK